MTSSVRIVGFPIGSRVRVNTPRERNYHNRVGEVRTHHLGEIGVDFGGDSYVWFLSNQLIKL